MVTIVRVQCQTPVSKSQLWLTQLHNCHPNMAMYGNRLTIRGVWLVTKSPQWLVQCCLWEPSYSAQDGRKWIQAVN